MTATNLIDLPIVGYYDKQRFVQFNPTDCANWILMPSDLGKKKVAMYPAMGRQHVRFNNRNQLVFEIEPREIFRSVDYAYFVVGNLIYRVDQYFSRVEITNTGLNTFRGDVDFDYLSIGSLTYACFADGQNLYIYEESTGTFSVVTDSHLPANPTYVCVFGYRLVVASRDSSQFNVSEVNFGLNGYDPATCFTVAGNAVFAQEVGKIRQLFVLQNTLYIISDFRTGMWANRPTTLQSVGGDISSFPFQRNTSIEFDFGITDPKSLDVAFDRACWVTKNQRGLIQVVAVAQGQYQKISTKAIDVLFQKGIDSDAISSPFLTERLSGFLYEYENAIFYRLNAGKYLDTQYIGESALANSIDYNFDVQQWSRAIEINGQRNRAQRLIYFANRNLVTVQGERTVYEFSGRFYNNEIRNKNQVQDNAEDSYIKVPMRYEKVTPIITIKNVNDIGYAEFITEYVEIDFAYGIQTSKMMNAPFQNAQYIIAEEEDANGQPIFISTENADNELLIDENSNFPTLGDKTYFDWFKPHIELLYSDDGGISFTSADVLQFSDLGIYEWRMRWHNLGASRNRCYKLVCVSPSPIVVLGGVMKLGRISGGAD